jgi:hypothetical protein
VLLENGVPLGSRAVRSLDDPSALGIKLEEIYCELLSELTGDVFVELILPFDYLCDDVESMGIAPTLPFPIPSVPICHRYPVVLRWRDRIVKPGMYQGEVWLRTATRIRDRLQRNGSEPSRWTVPMEIDNMFWNKVSEPDNDLLDLGYQGSNPSNELLARVLYHGTAFACWSRAPLPIPAHAYEEGITRLVTGGAFPELPRRAIKIRKQAAVTCSLALFWDEPDSNPVKFIRSFEEMK